MGLKSLEIIFNFVYNIIVEAKNVNSSFNKIEINMAQATRDKNKPEEMS